MLASAETRYDYSRPSGTSGLATWQLIQYARDGEAAVNLAAFCCSKVRTLLLQPGRFPRRIEGGFSSNQVVCLPARCKIIRTCCRPVQTLLQWNSDNHTLISPAETALLFIIPPRCRPRPRTFPAMRHPVWHTTSAHAAAITPAHRVSPTLPLMVAIRLSRIFGKGVRWAAWRLRGRREGWRWQLRGD